MAKPFTGTINVDIRDPASFDPGASPWQFAGGTIRQVQVNVSGKPYVDLEREAVAMMSRE